MEAYPKAGAPNPVVDLFVYDVASGTSTRMDVRDGKPFTNDVVGHYVYRIEWSPDGSELLIHRTNRRQNILEFAGCSPASGACRVIVREEWPASWVENHPPMQYLSDGHRFLWISERTGWRNLYLYDLSGELLATLTDHDFEVANIEKVDEEAGVVWYMARDGDNFMKLQLHRVGLDGTGDRRLTDPAFNHSVELSPDGRYFVDVAQTHDQPPFTQSHGRGRQRPGGAGHQRPDPLRGARPPAGGDVHLHRRGRRHPAPRHAPQAVELRSEPELSRPGERVRGSRHQRSPGDVLAAQPPHGVRVPGGDHGLPQRGGPGQAVSGRHLPEAEHGRDRRPGRGDPGPLGPALRGP